MNVRTQPLLHQLIKADRARTVLATRRSDLPASRQHSQDSRSSQLTRVARRFGFSRGAFTARALAGMLQRVGLLPAGNEETIPLAYHLYKGDKGVADGLAQETAVHAFKRTFSREVEVHFVGVWVSGPGDVELSGIPK